MSEKRTNSSLYIDQDVTTRSFTPFTPRTPRFDISNSLIVAKQAQYNRRSQRLNKSFRGRVAAENLAKKEAVMDPSNILTKRLIAGFQAKFTKLSNTKRFLMEKQKNLHSALQTRRKTHKELHAEELRLLKQIDDLGLQRANIRERMRRADVELANSNHKALNQKSSHEKTLKKLLKSIIELERQKKETKTALNAQRRKQRSDMRELLSCKKTLSAENSLEKELARELEEKRHLASVTAGKFNSELKDRVSEFASVLDV
eukprot:TRINITY_DN1146_c0_g1_i6.p1 TRINITY_DN1146_c0_g1~~TRINITY_DN1146_c0_g1_i6.p1  ORF type:complete len:259 (+),score=62.42 TRINITY_DN1146_c0_g1_i6:69-845(+)